LDLERLCHDPLMLKFLGEAFKDKEIPSGASRDEIFDKYVENTFCDEKAHLWPLVMRLALRVYNERVATNAAEVAEVDAQEAVAGAQNLLMISSLDIVVGQVRTRSEQNSINFKYDAFFEYVLARALMNEWKWGRSIQHAADTVRGFIGDSRSYRFLPGTLLYLLRFLLNSRTEEGWDAAVAVLTDASKGYDPAGTRETPVAGAEQVRWKTFFCGFVMTDLETAQDFLDDLVELARDASSVVRWSAGLALGTMAVPEAGLDPTGTEMANKALEGLEADSEWQGRETAAGALRQFHRTLGAMAPRLERLADDINWRVRRQAGNTLGDLCLLNRGNAMTLLGQWSEADNWRLRRAVVQARAGLMADPALGMRVLEKMIIDPREEIRWRSVNVLANLVTSHREFVAPALVLFAQLAEKDPSVWVRRHVAYWLPDLHHVANTEQRAIVSGEIAEVVVNDAHEHVRWAAARAFGGFAEQEQAAAEAWLAVLENEHSDSDRIGYAVRYSRAQIALTRKPPRRPTTVRAVMEATEPASLAQARVEELARSLRAPQRPEMLNADLCKNDRYTNIQDAIKAALLNDDDTQFFDLLRHDEDEGLRWGAASALAKQKRIRGAQLDEAVLGFSTDYQYWVRRECLTALADLIKSEGTLPSQELVNQILTSATDPEAEVRDAALQCLVALQATVPNAAAGEGLPAALAAAVRELGSDPDRQVRQFAQGALTA
jgi:HEAT repeat protein